MIIKKIQKRLIGKEDIAFDTAGENLIDKYPTPAEEMPVTRINASHIPTTKDMFALGENTADAIRFLYNKLMQYALIINSENIKVFSLNGKKISYSTDYVNFYEYEFQNFIIDVKKHSNSLYFYLKDENENIKVISTTNFIQFNDITPVFNAELQEIKATSDALLLINENNIYIYGGVDGFCSWKIYDILDKTWQNAPNFMDNAFAQILDAKVLRNKIVAVIALGRARETHFFEYDIKNNTYVSLRIAQEILDAEKVNIIDDQERDKNITINYYMVNTFSENSKTYILKFILLSTNPQFVDTFTSKDKTTTTFLNNKYYCNRIDAIFAMDPNTVGSWLNINAAPRFLLIDFHLINFAEFNIFYTKEKTINKCNYFSNFSAPINSIKTNTTNENQIQFLKGE